MATELEIVGGQSSFKSMISFAIKVLGWKRVNQQDNIDDYKVTSVYQNVHTRVYIVVTSPLTIGVHEIS